MSKRKNLIGVVQLVDELNVGGLERIAVDVANYLPQEHYRSYLCTTRESGPLYEDLALHVGHISLLRKNRFDILALRRFISFIREKRISIIHAHSSALFVASLASLLPPFPKIVWHCHSGETGVALPVLPYFGMIRRTQATIVVSDLIRQWIIQHLRYPTNRIWYVPNFSTLHEYKFATGRSSVTLPGMPNKRIVCVASIKVIKNQLTLIRAMPNVLDQVPDAHLILVGREQDKLYANLLGQEIRQLDLEHNVTFLGVRRDIGAILTECDIGILSSVSEGLPVALLEYGLAGLGVICTRVGQCAEVLDDGYAGILVPSKDQSAMASALISMLLDPSYRRVLGERLQERVRSRYSLKQAITIIDSVYQAIGGKS